MRVGLVCPYSLTFPGGVQAQILGLARVLRGLGHEARVLAPCDGPPPELFVTPLGNSIPTAANGSMAPLAPDPAAALRTIRALRDEQFDIVHIHEPLVPGPPITALTMHPAPVVATFHAAGDSSSYRWLNFPLYRLAGRIDARTAVSDDARLLAERYLGGSYEVLFNGVEVDRWRLADPIKPDGPTIFFCGRHEPRKGLEVLLHAFARLERDAVLWVAGEGPNTTALAAAAPPNVEWLGRISDDELAQRLRAASVFCAPSLHGESFGVVLLEAMAAGLPVVASDVGGLRELVLDGETGALVPPGDPTALADALRPLLADRELRRRLGTAGRERAKALFDLPGFRRAHLELYLRELAAAGVSPAAPKRERR
jgi:phosphatidylinositol alpha-mannosyltransferase